MKKIIISSGLSLCVLAGCSTPPPIVKVDVEPILVGIPINERVARSNQAIAEQLDLLDKVKANKYAGTFEMVQHNNGLDARKGSTKTLPQSYSKNDVITPKEQAVAVEVTESKQVASTESQVVEKLATPAVLAHEAASEDPMNKVIKKIEWDLGSANELAAMFSQALGYNLVVDSNLDAYVTLKIENETVRSAIEKFKIQLKNKATVLIIEKNKTFNIIYK